jgi:hypothetical protein
MSRTIPYFQKVIYPNSIAQGKNILISSSENAIRGLLMHLCEIPENRIHEVEIPTGLPLVYNIEKKCIQLFDECIPRENHMALVEEYDFGSAPELLFRPCNIDGGSSTSDYDNDPMATCFLPESPNGRSYAYDPIIRFKQSTEKSSSATSPFSAAASKASSFTVSISTTTTTLTSSSSKISIVSFDVSASS